MRIEILASAQKHGITNAEIRAAINFYALRTPLAARRTGTQPFFYTAPAAPNQPWIEVIADHINPTSAIVFHAMMLRPSLVADLEIGHLINPEYGPQRR